MYGEGHGARSRLGTAVTKAGVDHVRLWYHYLDAGDIDGSGSLLDEHIQVYRPDAPPGHGRDAVLELHADLAGRQAEHHIYKIIAVDDAIAVMGRCTAPAGSPRGRAAAQVEFADFFTLTEKGMLLSCRRYYFVAPEPCPGGPADFRD